MIHQIIIKYIMKKLNLDNISKLTGSGKYSAQTPMDFLPEKINRWLEDGLDLDPDFQRGHVWTEDQQIKFIEFLLRGDVMTTPILFNHPNWMGSFKGQMQIVDGKQRLTAMLKFMNDELTIFNDVKCSEIENLNLSTIDVPIRINDLKTRKEVLSWYLELNDGGTPHSKEEIIRVQQLFLKEI